MFSNDELETIRDEVASSMNRLLSSRSGGTVLVNTANGVNTTSFHAHQSRLLLRLNLRNKLNYVWLGINSGRFGGSDALLSD
jgi:hypothetical protein